jgi:hypothetical protein
MPGFSVRILELPEQVGEQRLSLHWLFLAIGLILVGAGAFGLRPDLLLTGRLPGTY